MKRTLTLFAAVLMIIGAAPANAQKKQLDHDVYDSWERVGNNHITADGRYSVLEVSPQQGDPRIEIEDLTDGRKTVVERGASVTLSRDGKWMIFRIKAPYAETRKARIAKKKADQMPKDSLAYMKLEDFSITMVKGSTSYKTTTENVVRLAYEADVDIIEKPKAEADTTKPAKKKGPKTEKGIVLLDLASGSTDTLRRVEKYGFNRPGDRMVVVFKQDKKDSLSVHEVVLYRLADMERTQLAKDHKFYSMPNFNKAGDKLLFLASMDSAATGSKHCSVHMTEDKMVGKGRKAVRQVVTSELIAQGYSRDLPEGWTVTETCNPIFSDKCDRVFLGVAPVMPPKDTTIVDFEAAQLDIWNWDVYMTPVQQRLNNNAIKNAYCRSVIDLATDPHNLIPLSKNLEERVSLVLAGEADWALVQDNTPYQLSSTWDSNRWNDSYIVSLKDGSRKPLFTKLSGGLGVSPSGKYLTWYDSDESCWFSYNVATGEKVNLTGGLDGIFFNDEDDHPSPKPAIDGPHWIEGDEAFLMADKFDLWKITPDGKKAENLTCGEGRRNNVQYRLTDLRYSDITGDERSLGKSMPIGRKDVVMMTVFDRNTKQNGFATLQITKPGIISSFTAPWTFTNVKKARSADVIAYLKGNFNNCNDAYVTRDLWNSEQKLSAINPQKADYSWGDVRLVKWNAYDGTPLEGLLYTPENYDPKGKYPMMVYFYEKNAQTMYNFITPAPSRSIICIPFYVSRGYVVFVPDIVYKDGHPGESAYNCICAGTEAMCEQFPFIDRTRMAIQGQSWGGYQTAYLVTRTNMYAAAGAGAPVSNMTSAYGGVRWGSGVFRAMQYEHGQSRIGKSLWDEGGFDLYVENSPVFFADKVQTPLLIMHNDSDGAVPWYQGLEYFMALRRNGKPCWLLEYNREEHNLNERRNCKDLSRRLQQFFDHYLKGDPMPAWMKTGVPYSRKGQYYGFEYAE